MATIRTVGGWCMYSRSDGKSQKMIIYSFLNRKCTHVRKKRNCRYTRSQRAQGQSTPSTLLSTNLRTNCLHLLHMAYFCLRPTCFLSLPLTLIRALLSLTSFLFVILPTIHLPSLRCVNGADKWKLMREKSFFGFVALKWARPVVQGGWSRAEGRDRCEKLTSFSLYKPSHVSDSYPEGDGGERGAGGGGFLYAEEKKGIVCPYLSVLFSGYSILAAESRGRLRQWFNTWLLSHFISVISPSHPTPRTPTIPSTIASSSTQEPWPVEMAISYVSVQLP